MRQNTTDLNLETPVTLDVVAALTKMESRGMVASLQNVQVYVLGVDNATKQLTYWQRLQQFWLGYFMKAGAHVERYSLLREVPQLEP